MQNRDADDKRGVSEGLEDAGRMMSHGKDLYDGARRNKGASDHYRYPNDKKRNSDGRKRSNESGTGGQNAKDAGKGGKKQGTENRPQNKGNASSTGSATGAAKTAGAAEGAGGSAGAGGLKGVQTAAAAKSAAGAAGTAGAAAGGSAAAPVIAIIAGVILVIAIIMALIGALTPNVTLNTIGANTYETEVEEEPDSNDEGNIISQIFSSIKNTLGNFFGGADEEDASRFTNVESYEASIPAFKETFDAYLDEAVNLERSRVDQNLSFGNGLKADYELTLENFDAQGDPFASVNYASLLAAYAVSDPDIRDSSLEKFTQALRDGEEEMLDVEYTYYDSDGNPLSNEEIIPLPEYAYDTVDMRITGDQYVAYVNAFPDGSEVVADAEQESLEKDIEYYNAQITSYDQMISDRQAIIDQCDTNSNNSASNIAAYQKEINKRRKQIQDNQDEIDWYSIVLMSPTTSTAEKMKLAQKISQLNQKNILLQREIDTYQKRIDQANQNQSGYGQLRDTMKAEIANLEAAKQQTIQQRDDATMRIYALDTNHRISLKSNIKSENIRSVTKNVTLYVRQLASDGTEKVNHYVSDKAGSMENDYVLLDQGVYGGNYYALTGKSTHYPQIVIKYYAEVALKPFDSSDIFDIFDIDPNAIYPPSEGAQTEITNEEMYNYFYDVLKEETDMADYGGTNSSGHVCSLTADEIQAYLDNISYTSGNRKQLVKTALELTGAVIYEWGGKPSGPGWNSEWWEPINHSNGYKGLDCSGFIDWVIWTAFDQNLFPGYSTGAISSACEVISASDLQPGDLGIKFLGGSSSTATNHVGMYIGTDAAGNQLWVHCTGGESKTVVVNNYSGFHYYLRIPSGELEMDNHWDPEISPAGLTVQNEDEMYVIAKCARHEGGSQSDVGKQAVVEATCNNIANKGYTVDQHNLYLAFSNQLLGKNFCDSYNKMYGTESGTNNKYFQAAGEPTQQDYAMIAAVVAGKRDYIKDSRVQNWRGSSNPGYLQGYIYYGQFPAGTGNKFFRPAGL